MRSFRVTCRSWAGISSEISSKKYLRFSFRSASGFCLKESLQKFMIKFLDNCMQTSLKELLNKTVYDFLFKWTSGGIPNEILGGIYRVIPEENMLVQILQKHQKSRIESKNYEINSWRIFLINYWKNISRNSWKNLVGISGVILRKNQVKFLKLVKRSVNELPHISSA